MRAKGLPKLYLDKAKNIDRKYGGTPDYQEGPIEQWLKSFGELQCLVAGQYGEVSQHYHNLLAKLAKVKVAHSHMGVPSQIQSKASYFISSVEGSLSPSSKLKVLAY